MGSNPKSWVQGPTPLLTKLHSMNILMDVFNSRFETVHLWVRNSNVEQLKRLHIDLNSQYCFYSNSSNSSYNLNAEFSSIISQNIALKSLIWQKLFYKLPSGQPGTLMSLINTYLRLFFLRTSCNPARSYLSLHVYWFWRKLSYLHVC